MKITSPRRPALNLPGLCLLLGGVGPSLLTEGEESLPSAPCGNPEYQRRRAAGLRGAWREPAICTAVWVQGPGLRTQLI